MLGRQAGVVNLRLTGVPLIDPVNVFVETWLVHPYAGVKGANFVKLRYRVRETRHECSALALSACEAKKKG